MTRPVHRKALNIERSINMFLEINFAIPESMQDAINFQDSEFSAIELDKWVDCIFLKSGAGKRSETVLQIDVYVRTKGKIIGSDRHGEECARLAEAIYEALHVRAIQIYNFATPTSPALLAKRKVLVRRSDGTLKEPEEETIQGIEDGIARRTLTYRFELPDDIAGTEYYDD